MYVPHFFVCESFGKNSIFLKVIVESEESTQWSVILKKDQIDELIKALNVKGIREKALKQKLESLNPLLEKNYKHPNPVVRSILDQPSTEIVMESFFDVTTPATSGRTRSSARNKPEKKSNSPIVREMISELEMSVPRDAMNMV